MRMDGVAVTRKRLEHRDQRKWQATHCSLLSLSRGDSVRACVEQIDLVAAKRARRAPSRASLEREQRLEKSRETARRFADLVLGNSGSG